MSIGMKRLEKEFLQLQPKSAGGSGTLPDNVTAVALVDDSFLTWVVSIAGPPGSPYAGGKLRLMFAITAEYPHKAPMLKFSPPVFHPSVMTSTGEVCAAMPALAQWKPTMTIRGLIEIVVGMLMAPSAENVVEEDIGRMLREQPAEFSKAVVKHMKENKCI